MKKIFAKNISREDGQYIKSRISLICSISCAIAKELDWGSETSFDKLIYAAHMHDLPLFSNPKLLKIQTIVELDMDEEITDAEREAFLNHPEEAAKKIAKDFHAPAEALEMVEQHHELPSRQGFPKQVQPVRIIPYAAILSVSIDLAQYILKDKNWKAQEYIKIRKNHWRGAIFTKIFKALEKMLQKYK
jgi:HD-GYP domain-containing protein (c-di-GMP phosphodiesterase class II)